MYRNDQHLAEQTRPGIITNAEFVQLVKSGTSEDLIINVIQQQPGSYSLGANELITLKEANGVATAGPRRPI